MFDILFNNTTDIQPEIHSTDTHGANEVNFALLNLFGYQFAPRYKDLYDKVRTSLVGFKHPSQYGDANSTWTPDRVPEPIRGLVEPEPKHGNVQYFSVNNATRDRTLAVIVSVGANFSQGPDALDVGVESALEPWRGPLEAVFDAYRRGIYRQWWRPSERRRLRLKLFSDLPIEIPRTYHYVMTNFSAWITKDPWSYLRGTEATEKLLLYPSGNVP